MTRMSQRGDKVKSKIIFIVVVVFIFITIFSYANIESKKNVLISEKEKVNFDSSISMMYESETESGVYIESNENTWPTDEYVFNETLSKCENGGTLLWDDVNKKVLVTTNSSDKCYVYFDLYVVKFEQYNILMAGNSFRVENFSLNADISLKNFVFTIMANDVSEQYIVTYTSDDSAVVDKDSEARIYISSGTLWLDIYNSKFNFRFGDIVKYEFYFILIDGSKSETIKGSIMVKNHN